MTIEQAAIPTLLWLGPADGAKLAEYANDYSGKLVLVEADELYQASLAQLSTQFADFQLISKAVDISSGSGCLYRYNLSEFNALAPATGLKQLFPGLTLRAEQPVETIDVAELVKGLSLENGDKHRLLITLPAQAMSLLKKLAEHHLLQQFTGLSVQIGTDIFYQGAATAAELSDWLLSQGYEQTGINAQDPDLPLIHFRKNPLHAQLQQSLQKNSALVSQQQMLQQQIDQEQAVALQYQQRATELQQQLLAVQQQLAVEAKAKNQLLEDSKALKAQLEQAGKAAAELAQCQQQLLAAQQQIEAEAKAKHQLLEDTTVLKAQLEQAGKAAAELAQCQQQLATAQQQVAAEAKAKNQLLEETTALKAQLEQARKAAAELAQCQQQLLTAQQQVEAEQNAKKQAAEQSSVLKTKLEQAEKSTVELRQQLEKTKTDLENTAKHASNRLEKISQLEKANRQLQETNQQLNARQQLLENEMLKAEAQIEIIKELILKD